MIWIGYTTQYRGGGAQLRQAAQTLAKTKERKRTASGAELEVRLEAVESKKEFVDAMQRVADENKTLTELHFLGHSGMYGPMFRTTAMPEQFSPHEWKNLCIPFAPDGEAFFHACRTARWFTPFFARTFDVPTSGYHWYTSFSRAPDRFIWPGKKYPTDAPLFLVCVQGKKSHGWLGSLKKYSGKAKLIPLERALPEKPDADPSYDGVAEAYAAVFTDIRVRADEWAWIQAHFPNRAPSSSEKPRLLDIGCGNGALLRQLSPQISSGHGVDASSAMIHIATRDSSQEHLAFSQVTSPSLPFPDASFDVVTSLLSFRYLDWDPIMNEIRRVLTPGGRLLIIDMVTAPVSLKETPRFVRDTLKSLRTRRKNTDFKAALARLVSNPLWTGMLRYNPIRAQHEMVWYLESRFPNHKVELLNVGYHARVLAFDSGPLQPGRVAPQSYP